MKLSKDLGVPMYKAVVESAEFAHNFSIDRASYYVYAEVGCYEKI